MAFIFQATVFELNLCGNNAAKAGFDDSFIQTLGRWKSNAFTAYIRTSVEDVAAASAILSHANP